MSVSSSRYDWLCMISVYRSVEWPYTDANVTIEFVVTDHDWTAFILLLIFHVNLG